MNVVEIDLFFQNNLKKKKKKKKEASCGNGPCNGGQCSTRLNGNYHCECLPEFTGVNCSDVSGSFLFFFSIQSFFFFLILKSYPFYLFDFFFSNRWL